MALHDQGIVLVLVWLPVAMPVTVSLSEPALATVCVMMLMPLLIIAVPGVMCCACVSAVVSVRASVCP